MAKRDTSKAKEGQLYMINSKRKDGSNEYWLYDCDEKIKWEDCKDYFLKSNAISPPHKAKDYAKKVKGEWQLFFRDEVEKKEESK